MIDNTNPKLKAKLRYHGHEIIDDDDLETAKGKVVLELNSNDDLVAREYDKDGNAEDNPYLIDDFYPNPCGRKIDDFDVLKKIRDKIGDKNFAISASALDLIKRVGGAY